MRGARLGKAGKARQLVLPSHIPVRNICPESSREEEWGYDEESPVEELREARRQGRYSARSTVHEYGSSLRRWKTATCVLSILLLFILALNGSMVAHRMEAAAEMQHLQHTLAEAQEELITCKRTNRHNDGELVFCQAELKNLTATVSELRYTLGNNTLREASKLSDCQQQASQCQQEQQKLGGQLKSKSDEAAACQQRQQQLGEEVKAKANELGQCKQRQQELQNKMQGLKTLVS